MVHLVFLVLLNLLTSTSYQEGRIVARRLMIAQAIVSSSRQHLRLIHFLVDKVANFAYLGTHLLWGYAGHAHWPNFAFRLAPLATHTKL